MAEGKQRRPAATLALLGLLVLVFGTVFMTVGVEGQWGFVLALRAQKLAGMALVGYAIAVSTILFQTLTQNRILTPSIMGFDALYVLIQTVLAASLGFVKAGAIDPRLHFVANAALMVGASMILYRWLFKGGGRDLLFLALAGLIFGGLLRSLSSFLQRVLDPSEFAVLQDRLFASFNLIDSSLLTVAAALILGTSAVGWCMRDRFDVLLLGRETAISLGLDYPRTVRSILLLIAVLVSVSTALVGPVTFFGLLVANLTYRLVGDTRHALMLPAAALIAIICLVGGQFLLERLFGFNTSLSIVIEFIGGITFIALLMRNAR